MKYLVIGAGKSGVAAANFLAARGKDVSLTDSKSAPDLPYPLHENVTRCFGNQDESLLEHVGSVVLSPGVPTTTPLVLQAAIRAIPVIAEVELAYRHIAPGSTVIAVTGSNGKSTTTALIGEILKIAGRRPIVAGNIGEPLTAALDPDKPRTYVLELSSTPSAPRSPCCSTSRPITWIATPASTRTRPRSTAFFGISFRTMSRSSTLRSGVPTRAIRKRASGASRPRNGSMRARRSTVMIWSCGPTARSAAFRARC
jgi:hypothetical protein